ncbi:Anoctamin-like protein [Hordeum vulgare]|nr:Anoctamin-like protein [Hordeum vulgare]
MEGLHEAGPPPFLTKTYDLVEDPATNQTKRQRQEEDGALPRPMEGLHEAGPPPFLTKTYDLVEDTATDQVVSWSRAGNSFVMWDLHVFADTLLPRLFKHSQLLQLRPAAQQLYLWVSKHAAEVVQDKLYVVGGSRNGRSLSDVQVFDFRTSKWSALLLSPSRDSNQLNLENNAGNQLFPALAGHSMTSVFIQVKWRNMLLVVAGNSGASTSNKVLENLIENSIPYLKYSYKKYSVVRKKRQERESPSRKSVRLSTRVEKEYLKLSYTANIGAELEDGLFDDFLEQALQFGMIMMFACAFPLIFCFAALVCGYDDSLQSSTHA